LPSGKGIVEEEGALTIEAGTEFIIEVGLIVQFQPNDPGGVSDSAQLGRPGMAADVAGDGVVRRQHKVSAVDAFKTMAF
jgi:hypothetical protein